MDLKIFTRIPYMKDHPAFDDVIFMMSMYVDHQQFHYHSKIRIEFAINEYGSKACIHILVIGPDIILSNRQFDTTRVANFIDFELRKLGYSVYRKSISRNEERKNVLTGAIYPSNLTTLWIKLPSLKGDRYEEECLSPQKTGSD